MIRILQVLPTLNTCGGVENYLMNYYAHMDLTDFKIDFCVHSVKENHFKEIIELRGGRVFVLPAFTVSNLKEIRSGIREILKNNAYDIIHCHQANGAYFYFKEAKKQGVKCRILHSHQTRAADKLSHAIRNKPLLALGKRLSTDYVACSNLAGDYLFKKNYNVVVNAVDVRKFAFSQEFRDKIREEYSVPASAYVVGHIGRMCSQKNQSFILDIFCEISKAKENAYLFLIGDGEDREFLENKAAKLGLKDRVVFTGSTTRTNEFYSALDAFLLPSLYEGLPVVGVEAQCNGLPVVTSTNVTRELDITGLVKFLPLKNSSGNWAETVLRFNAETDRSEAYKLVSEAGYSISAAKTNLENLYKSLYEKYKKSE